jgi:uncharacterized membrane protein YsdA (DUF1294 family)
MTLSKPTGHAMVLLVPQSEKFTLWNVAIAIGLLVLPVVALQQSAWDPTWIFVYALVLSALTYWAYAIDKRRAREGRWRLPEVQLHLLELLGGWPGAYLAQRTLRHKISKRSYQVVFWLIVLGYQLVAVHSLQDRQLFRMLLTFQAPL